MCGDGCDSSQGFNFVLKIIMGSHQDYNKILHGSSPRPPRSCTRGTLSYLDQELWMES